MKRNLIEIALIVLIVPQIAFAAWWNPASWFNSWSFFRRTDTQILENRIKELEKKLEVVATSTSETATTTKLTQTKTTPSIAPPKIIPIKTEQKQEISPINQPSITPKETKLEISNVRAIPSSYKISVQWNTSVISNGKVTLWPTETATGNIIVNTYDTIAHKVEIQTIPGKTYYYLVETNTSDGQIASSEQKEVTTPIDNVVPTIDSVTISRSANGSFIDFDVVASESVKITLQYQYNYSNIVDVGGEGVFVATSTNDFSESPHISVRMPNGWFPSTSVVSVKITAYDQALHHSVQYEKTVKISDIAVK